MKKLSQGESGRCPELRTGKAGVRCYQSQTGGDHIAQVRCLRNQTTKELVPITDVHLPRLHLDPSEGINMRD